MLILNDKNDFIIYEFLWLCILVYYLWCLVIDELLCYSCGNVDVFYVINLCMIYTFILIYDFFDSDVCDYVELLSDLIVYYWIVFIVNCMYNDYDFVLLLNLCMM